MATAREIHRHMKGIKNIGQITKAMKMVAAARLRKAQEKAGSSRPYALKIKEVLANIVCDKGMVAGLDAKKHPLLQKREVKKIGYLVVCSDKGLAGAYSSNALKKAVAEISEIEGDVDAEQEISLRVVVIMLFLRILASLINPVTMMLWLSLPMRLNVSVICSLMNCILFSLYLKPLCRKFRQAISSFR